MQIQTRLVLPSQQVSRIHQGADGAAPQALVRANFDRTPQSQNSIEVQTKGSGSPRPCTSWSFGWMIFQ